MEPDKQKPIKLTVPVDVSRGVTYRGQRKAARSSRARETKEDRMKIYLIKNAAKTAGVELHHTDNSGNVIAVQDVKITKDGICYELPANPSQRKWVNIKKFLAMNVDSMELEYKAPRKLATNWQSYLTDEEIATIKAIEDAAKARMEKALEEKAATEKADLEAKKKAAAEKKEAQIAKLEAQIAKLQGKN